MKRAKTLILISSVERHHTILKIYRMLIIFSLKNSFHARDNLRGQKSLGPLKMSLEMAHKVIVTQKKIISRSFLNSGTLIVISSRSLFSRPCKKFSSYFIAMYLHRINKSNYIYNVNTLFIVQ